MTCTFTRTDGAPVAGGDARFVEFSTPDATPVDVLIASVPTVGDYVQIPSVFTTGADPAGVFASNLDFQGFVMRTSVPATNLMNSFQLLRTIGVPLGIVMIAVGTTVVVRVTGVAATVDWTMRIVTRVGFR